MGVINSLLRGFRGTKNVYPDGSWAQRCLVPGGKKSLSPFGGSSSSASCGQEILIPRAAAHLVLLAAAAGTKSSGRTLSCGQTNSIPRGWCRQKRTFNQCSGPRGMGVEIIKFSQILRNSFTLHEILQWACGFLGTKKLTPFVAGVKICLHHGFLWTKKMFFPLVPGDQKNDPHVAAHLALLILAKKFVPLARKHLVVLSCRGSCPQRRTRHTRRDLQSLPVEISLSPCPVTALASPLAIPFSTA